MHSKIIHAFVLSAGIILIITGVAKLISATGDARILDLRDPILAVPFRTLFAIVGAIELLLGLGCLLGQRRGPQLVLIGWVALNFLVYRLVMSWEHIEQPCPCLGTLTESLHLSPATADAILKLVLAYLLAGSVSCGFWLWRQQRRPSVAL